MMIQTFTKSHHLRADGDDDDELDKIPNRYLRFCPLGFIPHTHGTSTPNIKYEARKKPYFHCHLPSTHGCWRNLGSGSLRALALEESPPQTSIAFQKVFQSTRDHYSPTRQQVDKALLQK